LDGEFAATELVYIVKRLNGETELDRGLVGRWSPEGLKELTVPRQSVNEMSRNPDFDAVDSIGGEGSVKVIYRHKVSGRLFKGWYSIDKDASYPNDPCDWVEVEAVEVKRTEYVIRKRE
jgi:hypothetical protein